MSVASLAALRAKLNSPSQLQVFIKNGLLASGTHWNSEWLQTGDPVAGSAPGAAAIPDRTTTGAIGQINKGGSEQRAWLRRYGDGGNGLGLQSMFALVDRIAHIGGLDGTLNTAQTVSFPSLTRYTSGVGVWAAIEVYTNIGATGTTATISYSNTVPTSGQTSPAIVVGGAGFQNQRTILPFGYASGDLGVTQVASVTLAASTGTAGNFGITLFKTLGVWGQNNTTPYPHRGTPTDLPGPMPVIQDGACLQLIHWGAGQATSIVVGQLAFFED
jgi:hypothetical protein